ncbi:DUF3800 domain-containing protein [Bosea vestrisii]|uniref:DUF3800 domain-containing protein n=1 Tax=Bosea vestrisii TaxID=151416 RepID=UPI0024E03F37|nr:DUF3800 domain-containing protein [Bosea vestrisii]WID95950.1 DUF3800 domain-containing protein [Bosea vestrisii]
MASAFGLVFIVSSDQPPAYHYVAFIDEAGDDGLRAVKPLTVPGSSEWLILSAVVIRAENESKLESWIGEIRASLGRRQTNEIHFAKLAPFQKSAACSVIAGLDVRLFVIASNKKNMQGYRNPFAGKIPSSNWFYCWMSRLLLERVTHFVKYKSDAEYGESRKIKLEYSARGGLKYSQMKAYYEWMKLKRHNPFLPWGRIEWDVLDHQLFKVYPHHERAGLQLADIAASAFFKACDKHDTGACDSTFAKLLAPRMARQPSETGWLTSGYGVKLMPSLKGAQLGPEQSDIFKFYGYPRQWWDPEAFS